MIFVGTGELAIRCSNSKVAELEKKKTMVVDKPSLATRLAAATPFRRNRALDDALDQRGRIQPPCIHLLGPARIAAHARITIRGLIPAAGSAA